jgi:TolB protein
MRTRSRRVLAPGAADRYNGPAAPDGSALLLMAVEDGARFLEIFPLPDGPPRRLTPALSRLRAPAFSPDGGTIYFEGEGRGTGDLYRVGRDGQGLRRLTDNEEGNYAPAVSPRGEVVFLSSRDRVAELYRMQPDGGGVVRLTDTPRDEWGAVFSADGAWLGLVSDREGADRVYVMRPDGSEVRRVDPAPGGSEIVEEAPAWSPTGLRLAYVRRPLRGGGEVRVLDLGSGARAVVRVPGAPATVAWSPDGAYLAICATAGEDSQIYLARAGGGSEKDAAALTSPPGAHYNPIWFR